jgi:hypothetical protein
MQIVVIEGEDAVNVVQQKTAVAPIVEVRDRNNQPVAGAVVRFAIRGGRASFNGARVMSVTTNVAGRAAVSGLTPTGAGALQISASAAFQGQTAAITIAQTNVLTVAQAVQVAAVGGGSGGGASAGASGAAAGGGTSGGVSATTLGIIGGAAVGGAVAAKEALGSSTPPHQYSGDYSGSLMVSFTDSPCIITQAHSGNVTIRFDDATANPLTGTGVVGGTAQAVSTSCNPNPPPSPIQTHGCCDPAPQISGGPGNVTFHGSHPDAGPGTWAYDFAGTFSGGQITGTFTLTESGPNFFGSATFPVTLTTSSSK